MHLKYIQKCRGCDNTHLAQVINLGLMHNQGSFIKKGVPAPPKRKTPNLIIRCDVSKDENACGLVQTAHSVPPAILYRNYWYQSGISATMKNHLASITELGLKIKTPGATEPLTVLDIASNDNTLLNTYPKCFEKFGIDPSDIAAKAPKDENTTIINDLFPQGAISLPHFSFDIITSIACYYDVDDPVEFAHKVSDLLTENGIWIFEVAYWKTMVEKLSYDSIVNEHVIHYHLAPLETILKRADLKIGYAKKTNTNGGSILVVAHCGDAKIDLSMIEGNELNDLRLEEFDAELDVFKTYINFSERVFNHKNNLRKLITELRNDGKTVHLYGASTKLNTLLEFAEIGPDLIPFAAERSPEKWGASTLSGISIISEQESRKMNPDYYLVGPYHFKEEILTRETETIKMGTKFIFPLPEIEIIG